MFAVMERCVVLASVECIVFSLDGRGDFATGRGAIQSNREREIYISFTNKKAIVF